MDGIKQQLSEIIKQKNSVSSETAELLAMKEIVMSGLSRCGFFKEYPYLTKFDYQFNNKYYLIFLDQKSSDVPSKMSFFIPFVEIELNAFGCKPAIISNKNGITISNEDSELSVFILSEDFDLVPGIFYHFDPLPYEVRSITEMNEGVRSSIQKIIDKDIIKKFMLEKNKNGAGKAPSKNKRNKKADDSVQQLSLFDL